MEEARRALGYKGSYADAAAILLYEDLIDLGDRVRNHYKRAVWFARYGRQNMLQWDDVPLHEIQRYAVALKELLSEEKSISEIAD